MAKAERAQDAEEAASTADALLEHAAQLFARKGFSETSMREIAEAAGVTKPMLYYYFGNKADLIRTLLGRSIDSYLAAAARAEDLPLEEALHAVVVDQVRFCDEHPAIMSLMVRLDATPPEVADSFDIQQAQMKCFLATCTLFEGESLRFAPPLLAQAFLALLVTSLIGRLKAQEQPHLPPPPATGDIIELFLRGALPATGDTKT